MRLKYLRIQSDISDHICAIPSCKELNMQIITNQFQKELKKHGSDHFPFLVSYQCLSEYDSNSFMWHCHPEIEITYVKEGSMHYRINNRSFHLKEGDIIWPGEDLVEYDLKDLKLARNQSALLTAQANSAYQSTVKQNDKNTATYNTANIFFISSSFL